MSCGNDSQPLEEVAVWSRTFGALVSGSRKQETDFHHVYVEIHHHPHPTKLPACVCQTVNHQSVQHQPGQCWNTLPQIIRHTVGMWTLLSPAPCKKKIYDVYSNFPMQKKHQKYSNQAKVGNFPNISAPIPNISRYHGYTIASRQHLNNWGWRFRGQADSSNNLTQHRHHLVKLNNGKVVKQQIAGGKSTEMTSKKVSSHLFYSI